MKSKLFIMAALCAIAFTTNAQTKGTNVLSLGFGSSKSEYKYNNGTSTSENSQKNSSLSLGYGLFIKNNEKIGITLSYGENKSKYQTDIEQGLKTYGGNLNYQKYYPIVNKLYAYAGGQAGYSFGKQTNSGNNSSNYEQNEYSAGAFGGISWFASKRFAFEADVLSASMRYYKSTQTSEQGNGSQENTNTSFGLNSSGVFNNLGFKIYFLF